MTGEKFEVTYYIDDGYVGDSPQYVIIHSSDVSEDMDDSDIEDLLNQSVQEDFQKNVSPYVKTEDLVKFVSWAKGSLEREGEV